MTDEHDVELDTFLSDAPKLTPDERGVIVRQALRLFDDYYVHLALKRSIHGVDPVRRLTMLQTGLDAFGDDQAFHEEVLAIFRSVRDLHTVYKLPDHFHQRAAVLPFRVEEYFDSDAVPRLVVSHVEAGWDRHVTEHSGVPFERGVVIATWNGLPVRRAIELNAERQGGCNPAARHARGVSTMTDRPLSLSPAPQETSIRLQYTGPSGGEGTVTCKWRVTRFESLDATNPAKVKGLGVDALGEAVRRTRKGRFWPELLAQEPEAKGRAELVPRGAGRMPEPDCEPPFESRKPFTDSLQYRTLDLDGRPVGHLRIRSFGHADTDGFIEEVRRILRELPRDGLIVDVRGNGGGVIANGEALLQLFTPRHVHPEPLQLRNTDATRRLSASSREVRSFLPSLTRALETADVYSDLQPLDRGHERLCNMTGQRYHGPVVLLVDALCYSTTDIFAAGFQDHGIGQVIGVDEATGAGGANVWDYERLRNASRDDAFEDLPYGTGMRVSLRRTLRVGRSTGVPVEEFGIKPDVLHRTTRADVLEFNADLLKEAVRVLREQSHPAFRLDVVVEDTGGDGRRLTMTTDRLTRLDAYADGRPLCASIDVDPAQGTKTTLDITARNTASLQIFGHDARGGPVAEAAGPVARFNPKAVPAPPAGSPPAPITPQVKEDPMAGLPFPDYDTMDDAQVRGEIAKRFFSAMDSHRRLVQAALDFEQATPKHGELIQKFKDEIQLLDDQIDEGTDRWGGLPKG